MGHQNSPLKAIIMRFTVFRWVSRSLMQVRQVSFQAFYRLTPLKCSMESPLTCWSYLLLLFVLLLFKNKQIHQSNPGPHLYLCMHLLLQVAPRELRRHKQPNAIDKRRHSFTTIAVIPSAGNPPVKKMCTKEQKKTKKTTTPSCCDFFFHF